MIAVSNQPDHSIQKDSILTLTFDKNIPEKSNNVAGDRWEYSSTEILGLRRITELIANAKNDPKILAILIKPDYPSIPLATIQTLKNAIEDFKTSGKSVYAYGDYMSQAGYYMSSVADSLYFNPNGNIDLRGFGAVIPYYKDLMDKLGIQMDVFYHGKYKSATESYRRNSMSPESREQLGVYITEVASNIFGDIALARGVTKSFVDSLCNNSVLISSELALSNHLVDSLAYWTDVESKLRKTFVIDEDKTIPYATIEEYSNHVGDLESGSSKNKIALVYAEGEIGYKSDEKGVVSYERYKKHFEKIRTDDNIKGMVLRVNSPGGSSFTSDVILNEIKKIQEAGKTVAVSMGDYAASGGYYIACSADKIFAEPNTLTGSIGVFSMMPDASKFFKEILLINYDTISSHRNTTAGSVVLKKSDFVKQKLQQSTDEFYYQFISLVAKERNMSVADVDSIAQGRVWIAKDALQNGLIDEIGTFNDAINFVVEAENLADYKIIEYPFIEIDFFDELIGSIMDQTKISKIHNNPIVSKFQSSIEALLTLAESTEPMARLPYAIEY